jgi:hypothetical protein
MSRVINTINTIRRLSNQAETTLEKIKPLIGEESNKKINEIQNSIPTESNVRQLMLDEIQSRGTELVCSIEIRNKVDNIRSKLDKLITDLQNKINASKEKLLKLQEQIAKIDIILLTIRGIINTIFALIPALNIIVQTAKVGLKFLKGQFADGATTVKLSDLIKQSESAVKEIQNSKKIFENKLKRITNKLLKPTTLITKFIQLTNTLSVLSISILGIVESYYLNYILLCDVEGDSTEDEDYANALSDATRNTNAPITLIEDDLLPNTIRRIKNANFKVIQYQIA